MPAPKSIKARYGYDWPEDSDDLEIEIYCIQKGGRWEENGKQCGEGLFHHYKRLQQLLWPEEDHHRWSDLILNSILECRILAVMGARDTGKTRGMSKFALTDYCCFPNNTLILISSTDLRSLELRVWGDLKDMFMRAKQVYPSFPGKAVDHLHGIFTDDLSEEDELRNLRKGILCVPCVGSDNRWRGLSTMIGIKQKRRRLLGDECFVAGSMVSTDCGLQSIETIRPGQRVVSAAGINEVLRVSKRTTTSTVRVVCKDGREFSCTPEHRIFTQKGWVSACHLSQEHYMLGAHETMQIMQGVVPTHHKRHTLQAVQTEEAGIGVQELRGEVSGGITEIGCKVLQSILCLEMDVFAAGIQGKILQHASGRQDKRLQKDLVSEPSRIQAAAFEAGVGAQRYEKAGSEKEGERSASTEQVGADSARRQWHRSNEGREAIARAFPVRKVELWNQDWKMEWQRISSGVQGGLGVSRHQTCGGSRWGFASPFGEEREGREENELLGGAWVDRVEVHKQTYSGRHSKREGGVAVYNLEVEGHPSYCVSGIVVHNCQFMEQPYYDALANLNKGDFKGVFVGNPIGEGDPLDKIAEPKDGWDSMPEPEKTAVWDNKFPEGRTINLVGTDSPNFDEPKNRYPYLIDENDIAYIESVWGRDSHEMYNQALGVRKPGLNARKVITRDMCQNFGAHDKAVWGSESRTRVYAIDAAYGGDRCVAGWCEFGLDMNKKQILRVQMPKIIPISVKSGELAEDQIAEFILQDCSQNEIPPSHIFHDSTGRGSLGTAISRIFSSETNPVEFGGNATKRPVCSDLYMWDQDLGYRRLKRADEHYSKFVTELWFSVRYAIEGRQIRELPKEVMEEGCMREWMRVKKDKIEVETKEDTKIRMGKSPDLFDWLSIIVEGARQLGFNIARLENEARQISEDHAWKKWLRQQSSKLKRSYALDYKA